MADWTLAVGWIGAITGIVSLGWHILNSRSKLVIDRLSFQRVRNHQFQDKEVIAVSISLKNKSNRSTTIEYAGMRVGDHVIDLTNHFLAKKHIVANSSEKFDFRHKILTNEFNQILENKPVLLEITIHHTFGELKKGGKTDFSSDYLNL